jgi:hypothetical protein
MRPGYLGKWIEFVTYDTDLDHDAIVNMIKEKWHKVKYSEFLEKEIEKGQRAKRARENANKGRRVNRVGDIGRTSNIELIEGKDEEEKEQIISDYQLALQLHEGNYVKNRSRQFHEEPLIVDQ